jgi:hypothetical protein
MPCSSSTTRSATRNHNRLSHKSPSALLVFHYLGQRVSAPISSHACKSTHAADLSSPSTLWTVHYKKIRFTRGLPQILFTFLTVRFLRAANDWPPYLQARPHAAMFDVLLCHKRAYIIVSDRKWPFMRLFPFSSRFFFCFLFVHIVR